MKKSRVVAGIMIILMLLCTSVYATISGNINITSSASSLSAGDEFTVTLSLSDISGTSSGVTSINGYININKDILENLTVDSIVTNSDGKVAVNSKNNLSVYDASSAAASSAETGITLNTNPQSGSGDYRLVIDLASPLTQNTDLLTIKFKVKSGVAIGTYENAISYTLFKIYSGTTDKSSVTSKSLDVTINEAEIKNDNTTDNTNITENTSNNANTTKNTANTSNTNSTKNTTNTNSVNNTTKNTTKNTSNSNSSKNTSNVNNASINSNATSNGTDNTTSKTSLPNTGYRLIILPIIVLSIAGFIFYRKYEQYKKY